MTDVLVLAEIDRGVLDPSTFEALTVARSLADEIHVLVCGEADIVDAVAAYGVTTVHMAQHELLRDFGPETWGQTLAHLIGELEPDIVLATGTSKGNEVLAQAATRLDLPFVANCIDFDADFGESDAPEMTRIQWGGSLLERTSMTADTKIVSVAHHGVEAEPAPGETPEVETFEPELSDELARTVCVGREIAEAGVTLATAPIVFSGGRGVGSAEAFAPLDELAALMGGRVGCSRAVTNNGWRPHSDQVGQTGTRIAPELYVASGISGAIQHWVGAMGSKKILAINTDKTANMVVKADYFVEGDLHQVLPAVIDEIKKRR